MRGLRHLIVLLIVFFSEVSLPLAAQDSTLPLKSGSVRFGVIGDMGTGDTAQYDVSQRMVQFHQNAKGFKRGERVTVEGAKAGRVSIKRADGSEDLQGLRFVGERRLFECLESLRLRLLERRVDCSDVRLRSFA